MPNYIRVFLSIPVVILFATTFNIQNFSILPPQCICVFLMDLRKKGVYPLFSIHRLIFIAKKAHVYCAVWLEYLSTVEVYLSLSSFAVGSMYNQYWHKNVKIRDI
jgi:hypothetical protein